MKVGKLGMKAVFVVFAMVIASNVVFAGPPALNPTKIVESGSGFPGGNTVGAIDKFFARNKDSFVFSYKRTEDYSQDVYRLSKRLGQVKHVISTSFSYDMFSPANFYAIQGLDVNDSSTVVKGPYVSSPSDYHSSSWGVNQIGTQGNHLTRFVGTRFSSGSGSEWSDGRPRGFLGSNPLLDFNSSGGGGLGSSASRGAVEIHGMNKFNFLFSGQRDQDEYGQYSYPSIFPIGISRVDQESDSFLISARTSDTDFSSYLWQSGTASLFQDGLLQLGTSGRVHMPAGRWRDGRVSGRTQFLAPNSIELSGGATVIFGPGGVKAVQIDGQRISGVGFGQPLYGEIASHLGDTVLWTGRSGNASGWKFLAYTQNGVTTQLFGLSSPLFGSTIQDFEIIEESLEMDGFSFWYKLANGKTGIAHSNAVPEPGTLAALGLGALLLKRRRTNRSTEGK